MPHEIMHTRICSIYFQIWFVNLPADAENIDTRKCQGDCENKI